MSTAVQAAEHVFISISRFRDLVAIGTITRASPNGYKLARVREEYCKNAQAVMQGREADGPGGLTEQRTRIAAATALKLEAANKLASGETVPITSATVIYGAITSTIKETLLGLAGKIADGLRPHTSKDRSEIWSIVDREVRQTLTVLGLPQTYVDALVKTQVPPASPIQPDEEVS
ncbi:hypothetical protein [Bradyrhizobium erythrophlei]|uniref:Phage DNA packaging protein, Nu1 subunit of terminase n=1 Tax=Bradyrhizobium erythrophlei TaxID=1437360 RepID=A0A1M5MU86_9BRAD|nr:hypothetical protein [Bradyrhizobium erythrophlei]SHG80868.1 hypothetical protein SAMN05443248_2728 [Bradyrhizobium erythrophlei]